jgi:signal transduction histidine kinase
MKNLLNLAARFAFVIAFIAVLIGVGAIAGVWPFWLAMVAGVVFTVTMSGVAMWISRIALTDKAALAQLSEQQKSLRAAINTQNRGYCLFGAEGQMLETFGAQELLQTNRVAHFDDIVKAVHDSADLLAMFRQLQQTGEAFVLHTANAQNRAVTIRGLRHRSGPRPNDIIDVLWIRDYSEIQARLDQAAAEVRVAETRTAQLYTMLDRCKFPIWLKNGELKITWTNQAYAEAVEASRDDAVARQMELLPQASLSMLKVLESRTLGTRQTQLDRQHIVIKGQRRLIEINCAALDLGDASRDQIIGYALDVTAEDEKDAALKRHILAHHEVLENLATPIVIYGPDQRLDFYNRAYVRLWDHDENFLQSKPGFTEVLEDLRSRRRLPEQTDFQRYKRERSGLFTSLLEPREDMLHLPDGTTLRMVVVPHPFGGLMFVHEDVTDKLALESSYNTLIAVQRETLDNLAEGIAVFGADGRLKLFNPAFARIWKMPQEELATEPHITDLLEKIKPLFHYENWPRFKSEMVAYTLDRTSRSGRLERADGGVVEFATVPLPDGAVLNSYLDVTDTARVEQALRASNAALATADRLKSEFVANVSYQLRTPLNTIMGFAEILTNQYFGTLNERQLEYARTMMESSKRLKALIDDVLDLATIEAGRMALDRRAVPIAPMLQAVAHLAGERARQQALDITVDVEAGAGSFEVDDKRMKQVLFNLVSNSIQYTPAGGRITLQAQKHGAMLHISVIDNGIGISPADQERIWGKFERANPQARQTGAGLGLALVRSFVELHGGKIELKSAINQGTTITLIMPIRAPEVADKDQPPHKLAAE